MTWRIIAMLFAFGFLFAPQLAARGEGEARFKSAVVVETGDRALGAYEFTVEYDPSGAEIESISGAGPFADNTFSNPSTYKSGRTRFLAFQSSSLHDPTGSVRVADIQWKKTGQQTGATSLRLSDTVASDTAGSFLPSVKAGLVTASGLADEKTAKTINPPTGPGGTVGNPDAGRESGADAPPTDDAVGEGSASTPNTFAGGWGCSRFF